MSNDTGKRSLSDLRLVETLDQLLSRAIAVCVLISESHEDDGCEARNATYHAARLVEDMLGEAKATVDAWHREASGQPELVTVAVLALTDELTTRLEYGAQYVGMSAEDLARDIIHDALQRTGKPEPQEQAPSGAS